MGHNTRRFRLLAACAAFIAPIAHAQNTIAHGDVPENVEVVEPTLMQRAVNSGWFEADTFAVMHFKTVEIHEGLLCEITFDGLDLDIGQGVLGSGDTIDKGVYWIIDPLGAEFIINGEPVRVPPGLVEIGAIQNPCSVTCGPGYYACCFANTQTGRLMCICNLNTVSDAACQAGGKGSTNCYLGNP